MANLFRDSKANRKFQGIWVPSHIWFYEGLNMMEKMFYLEINSLDNDNGCFASNDYFAKFFGISKSRCSEYIKSLEIKNVISIEIVYKFKNGRKTKEIDKRVIRVNPQWERGIQRAYEAYMDARACSTYEERKEETPQEEKPVNHTPEEETNNPIRKIEGGYSKNRRGVFEKSKDNNNIYNNNINISLSIEDQQQVEHEEEQKEEREKETHPNVILIREKTGLGIRDKQIIKKVSSWQLEYLKIAIENFIANNGNTFKYLENGYNMAAAGELKAPQKQSSAPDKIKRYNAMISHGDNYVDDIEYLNSLKDQLELGIITKEQYDKEVKARGYSR